MNAVQPAGATTSSLLGAVTFNSTPPFAAGQILQGGTTSVYLFATNADAINGDVSLALVAVDGGVPTPLGATTASGLIPPNPVTPAAVLISFPTNPYTFTTGGSLQLTITSVSPAVSIWWDGAYNTARLVTQ